MIVLHVIVGLGDGGAEGVLSRLCLFDDSSKHTVISLMGDGKYGPILRDGGVEVICLGLGQNKFGIKAFLKLIRIIKKRQPDVVQTWMYHADFIGGLAARLAGVKNICWGVRTSDISSESFSTKLVARACSVISNIISSKIICCAESALQSHKKLGYSKEKLLVIRNGYDFNQFNCEKTLPDKVVTDYRIQFGMVGR
ncbi:glycosyltransferase [Pseudoalteromonas sp. SWYJZ12]|uniref:glycosyltransferase n=1 Tax=Pseudoalteromonas sp. SWYJZ12 TaxID=2792067 RepID=UPI0018CF7366|nr:glycosyltransferase [Pseudoalteromonas sp. SWYJZ12]MBH0002709.1 glycosyltransferase [Pseudoalteromonas sp. SWYJZ12]